MKSLSLSVFLLLIACNKNPLGNTAFYSCNHSPGGEVGLPIECQADLDLLENLSFWLDPTQTSTVTKDSNSFVDSIVDKSGNLITLLHTTGDKALIKAKSSNQRDSLSFESLGSYGMNPPQVIIGAGASFTLAFSFKIRAGENPLFTLNSGADLLIQFSSDLKMTFSLGALTDESVNFNFIDSSVNKVLFTYTPSNILIHINETLVLTQTHSQSLAALNSLNITGQSFTELNEVLLYEKELSSSERQKVFTYFNNKWGY